MNKNLTVATQALRSPAKKTVPAMSNDDYIIRDIFYKNHSFLVANAGALDSTCPTSKNNFTLDRIPFNFSLTHANIFFFYNCSLAPNGETFFRVPCASNSSHKSVAVFVHEGDLNYWNFTSWKCQSSVSTPIDVAGVSGYEKIMEMNTYYLKEGFLLNWTAMNCSESEGSSGRCGFDNNEFMCFCKDQPHRRSCNDETIEDFSAPSYLFYILELVKTHKSQALELVNGGKVEEETSPFCKNIKPCRTIMCLKVGPNPTFYIFHSLMRDLGSSSMASYAFVVISFFLLSPFASHSAEEDFSHCKPFSCGTFTNISHPFFNSSDCGLSTIIQCADSKPMIEFERKKYEVLEIFSNNKTIRIRDPEFIKHLRDKNCDELSNFTKPLFPHLSFEVMSPNLTFFICNKADSYKLPKHEFFNGVHGYRGCGALDLFFYDMNLMHGWHPGLDCEVVQLPVHEPSPTGDLLSLLEAGFDLQWSLPRKKECGDRDPFSYSLPPAPAPAPVPKFLGSDCPVVQFPKHDLPSHWEWNWRPDDLLPLLEPEFDLHWSIPPDSKCQPSERNGTICVGSSTRGFRCVDSKKVIS
ncbi:hypothetical protein HHK36_014952 [Tetracentron sinense]|uniref:Wall-associated receptor kinase galacturonan-binding domain-containing protein n=1 Tax=Tetracentron sinense TaxID=13715 RepID=A0A834Z5B2_TETSI|nr:hypothetical protein HHK36_014952 [Tetracentron sinense]